MPIWQVDQLLRGRLADWFESRTPTAMSRRITPVCDSQSGNPIEVRRVAGDKRAVMLDRRCRDDQIGVTMRLAGTTPFHPQFGRVSQDVGRYCDNERAFRELAESRELSSPFL
jgi:hypothetical protein